MGPSHIHYGSDNYEHVEAAAAGHNIDTECILMFSLAFALSIQVGKNPFFLRGEGTFCIVILVTF